MHTVEEVIDQMIIVRQQKIVECNDMKIELLSDKKKPEIVLDSTCKTNVNMNDISNATNQLDKFILITESQIEVLEELRGYVTG